MTVVRLVVCVCGIYASFLSWGLVQERLSTTPYTDPTVLGGKPQFFRCVLFLNTIQSLFCALAAFAYMLSRKKRGITFKRMLGLPSNMGHSESPQLKSPGSPGDPRRRQSSIFGPGALNTKSPVIPMLARCFQCALMASFGSPFGYAALRYISYPTQILGKSCKLVPVMLMNIVLYRRKFAPHKYLVVFMVTLGISFFMLYAPPKPHKIQKSGAITPGHSLLGIGLLLINLLADGAVNSTQDEVFSRYKVSGTQMMFFMNTFSTLITTFTMIVPLPAVPFLSDTKQVATAFESELWTALRFINAHPAVLRDIVLFSLAGAIGQLFIFDTLEQFGSLTLVTITVTRKLFTMLLSVFVFNHQLSYGQWFGCFVVFAGIGVEAQVKRKEGILKKQVITEDAVKARVKAV